MTIDLEKWRAGLVNQRKTYVNGKVKEGENWMTECFRKVLDPHKKCIPILFATSKNLYKMPTR